MGSSHVRGVKQLGPVFTSIHFWNVGEEQSVLLRLHALRTGGQVLVAKEPDVMVSAGYEVQSGGGHQVQHLKQMSNVSRSAICCKVMSIFGDGSQ